MNDESRELRYELKMPFEAGRIFEVRSWVRTHPCGFHTAYPRRRVNNIYFDLPGMPLLSDHLDGVEERYKLRFRWYGVDCVQVTGILEVKHKKANLGWKEHQPISATLNLKQMKWTEITRILASQTRSWVAEMLQSARPVLINDYQREYFVSGDGLTRLTLDYDLRIFHQQFHLLPNLVFREPRQNRMLIELKSGVQKPQDLADLLAEFPLRVSRYSKYVDSLDALTERLVL
jgi:SPX domain protein involved in polyphosphate accumulation